MGRISQAVSDVPFLCELNRVNVALFRTRLLAVAVSGPAVTLPRSQLLNSYYSRAGLVGPWGGWGSCPLWRLAFSPICFLACTNNPVGADM